MSRGRPFALGLFRSVAMVLALLRQNIVQQLAAEIFGVSQSTVSLRFNALREVMEAVLAEFVPTPAQIAGNSTHVHRPQSPAGRRDTGRAGDVKTAVPDLRAEFGRARSYRLLIPPADDHIETLGCQFADHCAGCCLPAPAG